MLEIELGLVTCRHPTHWTISLALSHILEEKLGAHGQRSLGHVDSHSQEPLCQPAQTQKKTQGVLYGEGW